MHREFPLALIFGLPLLAGLLCIFAGAAYERRFGARTVRNVLAYVRLGAHTIAGLFAVQAMLAFVEPDPRALQQGFGTGLSAGSFAADLGFMVDELSAIHVAVLMGVGLLDGFTEAVFAGRRRLVAAGRRSLIIAIAVAFVMASSLAGAMIAWMALAPVLLIDSRRRGDGSPTTSRRARERVVRLETVGLGAAAGFIVLLESTVGSQQWDVIARAAFSVLRVEPLIGVTVASWVVALVVIMIATRLLGIAQQRMDASVIVTAGATGVACAYLGHRCAWLIGSGASVRINVLVGVALATALVVAWAVARDDPHGFPGGRTLARPLRGIGGFFSGVLAGSASVIDTVAHAVRGVDVIAVDVAPPIAGEILDDARAGSSRLARRLGFASGGGRPRTLAMLAGIALVIGFLYFKPGVASVLPNEVHGFGGLLPTMKRSGARKSRAPAPAAEMPQQRTTLTMDKERPK